ncbi:hypothetical protein BAE30_03915 [Acidithiobacillus caldus]|uniref:Uncharacterized protein n=1 Tax=Acidithiobacillus caldus TaxID=33059 RepID=A0A1E7YZ18_9PROT|nr:hypothetical protein BAE30_03915 [Acidithiobacillus caldus]
MAGDGAQRHLGSLLRSKFLSQAELLCRWGRNAAFAFLPEELAAEPIELLLQTAEFCFQCFLDSGIAYPLHLPGSEGLRVGFGYRDFCRFHCRIIALSHHFGKLFGGLAMVSAPLSPHLDTFQQELQTSPIQLACWWSLPAPELASLQALGPEAVPRAVPIQDFHLGGAAVHKDKTVPRQWVVPKKLTRQGNRSNCTVFAPTLVI